MAKPKDITGNRYGKLVAAQMLDRSDQYGRFWRCICDCGNEKITQLYVLNRGTVQSCGCAHHEGHIKALTTHGMTGSPTWNSWAAMKYRCYNSASKGYKHYGGRGIEVCASWLHDFQQFYNDMGERPEGATIDRVDVDGHYSPGNCRWADPVTQGNNKRRIGLAKSDTPGVRQKGEKWIAEHNQVRIGTFGDKQGAIDAKNFYMAQQGITR